MTDRGQDTAQSGFALFVVLMFLMLAAAIATPFFSTARDYAFILRNVSQASRERGVSEGLLALSAQRYFELANRQEKLPAQVSCTTGDNGETLFLSFQNHMGLIDLNAASSQLLRIGFVALGVDASAAQQLAATVESYRSPDPGARGESGSPVAGGLKKAPFESPAELLDFRLPANIDAAALDSVFTVHAKLDAIIEGFVSPRLAKALGSASPGQTPPPANEGAAPAPAITVDAYFAMSNGRLVHGRGTYLPQGGTTVKRHGPAFTTRGDAAPQIDASQPQPVDCARFFDERSLPVLVGLLN